MRVLIPKSCVHTASHQVRCVHTRSYTPSQVCSQFSLKKKNPSATSTSPQILHLTPSFSLSLSLLQSLLQSWIKDVNHDETLNPKHRNGESRVLKPPWVFSGDPWVLTKLSIPVLAFSRWTPISAQTSFYLSPIVQFYPHVETPNLINTTYQKRYTYFLAGP